MRLEGESKLVRQAKNGTNYTVWFCKPISLKMFAVYNCTFSYLCLQFDY